MLVAEAVVSMAGKVLDKFIPDADDRRDARQALLMEAQKKQDTLLASDELQSKINLADARSTDPMQKRWRPFIGWVCGLALAVYYLLIPLVGLGMAVWYAVSTGQPFAAPEFDIGELSMLLFGLLGLGAYRSIEKVKGKA